MHLLQRAAADDSHSQTERASVIGRHDQPVYSLSGTCSDLKRQKINQCKHLKIGYHFQIAMENDPKLYLKKDVL